jgi:hypothetical protein
MPSHFIPPFEIKIVPSITVEYVAVRAEWRSCDGTDRTHQVVLHVQEFKQKLPLVVEKLLEELLIIEEELNGKKE